MTLSSAHIILFESISNILFEDPEVTTELSIDLNLELSFCFLVNIGSYP